jgi:hypothetical protein
VTGLGYLYSCGYRSKLWARRRALRRLLRPPLLRGLRALPGVPRAQGTRLRHVPRYVLRSSNARVRSSQRHSRQGVDDDELITAGWEENMERMGKADAAATASPHMNPGMSR